MLRFGSCNDDGGNGGGGGGGGEAKSAGHGNRPMATMISLLIMRGDDSDDAADGLDSVADVGSARDTMS